MREVIIQNKDIAKIYDDYKATEQRAKELYQKMEDLYKEINALQNKINNVQNNNGVYKRQLLKIAMEEVKMEETEKGAGVEKNDKGEVIMKIETIDDVIENNKKLLLEQFENAKKSDAEAVKEMGEIVDEDNLEVK